MNASDGGAGIPCYRLRVDEHLGPHWAPWFGGLSLARETDGTTTLTGEVADQAQLHGLLARVRDLGLTLVSVQVLDPATAEGSSAETDDASPRGGPAGSAVPVTQPRKPTSPDAITTVRH